MAPTQTAPQAKPASTVAPPAQNTSKRDFLISLEQQAQRRWAQDRLFEQDSPYATGEAEVPTAEFAKHAEELREKYPKVLATMPYPVSPPEPRSCAGSQLEEATPSMLWY